MAYRPNDKIYNNNYNKGHLDYLPDEEIKLQASYKNSYLMAEYDMENYTRLENLCEEVYDYIDGTKFEAIFKDVRIIKKVVPEILDFILPFLDKFEEYTFTEKFYVICEMTDIKETIVWEHLPPYYRDKAKDELSGVTNYEEKQDRIKIIDDYEEDETPKDIDIIKILKDKK